MSESTGWKPIPRSESGSNFPHDPWLKYTRGVAHAVKRLNKKPLAKRVSGQRLRVRFAPIFQSVRGCIALASQHCSGKPTRWSTCQPALLVEEADEILAATGLLELAYRFGFDLANTLPGHFEDMAHFLQRVAVAVAQTISQLDDLAFAVT